MRTPMTAPPQQRSSFWRKAASTIQPPTKSMYYVLLVLCIIPQGRILLPPSAMDPGHLGKPLLARHTIEAEKGHILVSSTHHGSPSRARHLLAPWYRRVRWRQRMYLSGSARSATMVQSVQGRVTSTLKPGVLWRFWSVHALPENAQGGTGEGLYQHLILCPPAHSSNAPTFSATLVPYPHLVPCPHLQTPSTPCACLCPCLCRPQRPAARSLRLSRDPPRSTCWSRHSVSVMLGIDITL